MNGIMTLAFPQGMASSGDPVVLLGVPSEKSAKQQLSGSVEDILKNISAILTSMLTSAIEKKTAQEFRAVYIEAFPVYMRLIGSLSGIIQATVKRSVIERVVSESYCELEADIKEHAAAFFGEPIREQAHFTVWTLRKIDELANEVVARNVPKEDQERDEEYASHFLTTALWARFNVDCLRTSMRTNRSIYPEVLNEISDGLRSAVNAYAWIKQAFDLRSPRPEPDFEFEMDDDDKQLLRESMFDMVHESV